MRYLAAVVLVAAGCGGDGGGGSGRAEAPRVLDGRVMLRLQSIEEFLFHESVRYHTAQDVDCDGEPPDSVDCGWTELLTEPLAPGDSVLIPAFPEGRWIFEMTTRFGTCTTVIRVIEEETDPDTEEWVLELCG